MSLGRFAIFLLVVGGLDFALHRYVWARLVRDAELPQPWARVATIALIVLAVMLVTALPLGRVLPRAVMTPIAFLVFTWLGVLFVLFVLLAVGDVARLVWAIVERARHDAPDAARRLAIGRVFAAATGVLAAAISGVGIASAVSEVEVRRHRVPLRRLPAALEGLTVVQLTDLHVGPTIGHDWLARVVEQTNALKPDIVAITGDLVDGSVDDLRRHVAPLANLSAPLGVFFVTGNHEYYSGVDEWIAELGRLGVRVLRNERVELRRGDAVIDLAGVDDWSARSVEGHGPNLKRAVEGRDTTRELLLLAHQPKQIVEAAAHGVGLQLSGHTHGGQIFPFNFLVHLQQPYVAGLHRHGDAHIYVSRGTGYWGPPMRVGIPSEISHFTLVVG